MEFTGERVVPGQMTDSRDLQAHYARYLWAMHPFCLERRVVDISCGTGYGTQLLSCAAVYVTGIDNDRGAIEHAREFYKKIPGYNLGFIEGDCYDFSRLFRTKVDVVVSFETVEHLKNPELFLDEAYDVLSYNGILIASAPWNSGSRFHVKDYTLEDLVALVSKQFHIRQTYVQEIGAEMVIKEATASESEHPTWLVVASKF